MEVAHIPPESQADVVKVQLKDVTRTLWKSKEARLEKPIAWKDFLDEFYARFFPQTAQDDMEQMFIELRQEGIIVDAYVR